MIEPLGSTHDRAAFSCGVEPLDRYLKQQASQDMNRRVANVRILRAVNSFTVAGYYTLSATSIEPTGLPATFTKRLPRYPTLPALLIGRLAVDQGYRGQRLGELLLTSAFRHSLSLSNDLGAVALVVNAKDDQARQFYERYDFQRCQDDPLCLFLPMKTIETLFTE